MTAKRMRGVSGSAIISVGTERRHSNPGIETLLDNIDEVVVTAELQLNKRTTPALDSAEAVLGKMYRLRRHGLVTSQTGDRSEVVNS